MKVLFMGTPAFAVDSLNSLLQAGHEVVGVVTRPDARSGRGLKQRPSPVKILAQQNDLPLFQPHRLKDPDLAGRLRGLEPDILAVVAYGRILPPPILEIAPLGAINLHASLLPRYRGAAPAAWAIIRGETETGVTTMKLIPELDAGDILMRRATPIGDNETAGELERRLAVLGAALLVETLERLAGGGITPEPQRAAEATYAPILTKLDGVIDWADSAVSIARRVRGLNPWPGAQTRTGSKRIVVWSARAAEPAGDLPAAGPGTIVLVGRDVLVACGEGSYLRLTEIQPEGRRRMPASQALSGRHLNEGERLGGA